LLDPDSGIFVAYPSDVPYLQIPSFGNWSDRTYDAVKSFLAKIKDEENLIIDIRGNGGGSDLTWTGALVAPLIDSDSRYTNFMCVIYGAFHQAVFSKIDPERFGIKIYQDDSWQEDYPYIKPEYVEGLASSVGSFCGLSVLSVGGGALLTALF